MDTDVQIAYLADHKEYIEVVAGWLHAQWGHETPNVTLSDRVERVRASAVRDRISLALLALADAKPIGTASLVLSDMSIHPELTPWLACVYVEPAWRGRSIGSRLVVSAMRKAQELDVKELYLFTPDRQSFYSRLDWKIREVCQYRGHDNWLMTHDLQTILPTHEISRTIE